MSDFECNNGHLMRSGDTICKECGGRLTYMDGRSRWELARMEKAERQEDEYEQGDD